MSYARSPHHKSEVRYWRSESDGRLECIEDHDCTLPLHKLKYSCNVKDTEWLKCIICIECFILQHVARSPDRDSDIPYWQSESDVRLEYIEDHDCTLPRPRERHNLHRCHSSANPRLYEM